MKAARLAAAAARLQRLAGGPLDVAIVLGSGLADAVHRRIEGDDISYERLHAPRKRMAGHPCIARAGTWAGKRVVAFGGRPHLHQGYDVRAVTYLERLAAACGVKTIVLTNAAGGLDPSYGRGDVMLIRDHLNLTGATPLRAHATEGFLDLTDAYAPHLRELARDRAGVTVREGIYAGVRGPQYETAAEREALRRLGADAVGMSTVLETIAARALGLDVLGISLITNPAAEAGLDHADVVAAAQNAGEQVANIIAGVLGALEPPGRETDAS